MPRDHNAQFMRSPQFRANSTKPNKKRPGQETEEKIEKFFRKFKFWKR
jgi:hypothetical protein